MNKITRTLAAIAVGGVLGLTAFTEGAALISCAFAESSTPSLLPVADEPAPKLTVDAPLPGPLARGAVLVPYHVENLRILSLLGEAANDVSPRVGHLHVTLDDLPWRWGEFSNDGNIVVVGLPAGPHNLRIDLAGPDHKIFAGQTVAFVVPAGGEIH
jgi:hypothetical protein